MLRRDASGRNELDNDRIRMRSAQAPAQPGSATRGSRRIQSWLAIVVLAALFLATAIAFVMTERLKLVPSPILDTVVSKTFAPQCNCSTNRASITFRLRQRGLMAVEVVTMNGHAIRRLAAHRFDAGLVSFEWYGRDGAGRAATEGAYKIRVRLPSEHRTIVLPNVVRLDRTPPTIHFTVSTSTVNPGRRVRIRYRLSEAAHPLLFVDGTLAVRGRWPYLRSSLDWFAKVNGLPIRAGRHRLTMRARDLAGNLSRPGTPVVVSVVTRPHPHLRTGKKQRRRRRPGGGT